MSNLRNASIFHVLLSAEKAIKLLNKEEREWARINKQIEDEIYEDRFNKLTQEEVSDESYAEFAMNCMR